MKGRAFYPLPNPSPTHPFFACPTKPVSWGPQGSAGTPGGGGSWRGSLRGVLVATIAGILAGCGPNWPGALPNPLSTPNATAQAWFDCGATKVPPASVLQPKVPKDVQISADPSLTPKQQDREIQAYFRGDNISEWALNNDQLAFLQSYCVSLPAGKAEADDINAVQKAEALHGSVVADPPSHYLKIGLKAVPSNISDEVFHRLGVKPALAVVTVTEGAAFWAVDSRGQHIQLIARADPGEKIASVTLGQVKDDGIGLRIWEVEIYRCLDPEVAGLCDGIV